MATAAGNRRRMLRRRDSRAEELYETKQLYTDYFAELRRGYAASYDPNKRSHIVDNIVHPKHGRWRGMEDPYQSARPPDVYRSRAIFAPAIPQTLGRLGPRARARLQDAYSTTFKLNRNFTPAHVTFRKILGYGGFGVAALFGLNDSTGRVNTIVVKADLRPGSITGVKTEKKHMIMMSGAKHVVQRTLLIAFPWPKDPPVSYDHYFGVVQRFIIKLGVFFAKVISLFILTSIQLILVLVEKILDIVMGEYVVVWEDDPDAPDDQDPQPAAVEPVAAEPPAVQSGSSGSGASQQGPHGSGSSRPGPSGSGSSRSGPSGSGSSQPGPSGSGSSRPGFSGSGFSRPPFARSGAPRPSTPEPARAQPAAAQPAAAGPDPAEPEPPQWLVPSLQSWTWKKLWPDWPKEPRRALGIDGAIRQNRIKLDKREDIISMEYLKFGDLGKWIGKMAMHNNTDPDYVFSEKLAWVIFECLWRGCIAMAHPKGFYQGKDPMNTQIPQMTESIEAATTGSDDPLVHFDLDPQNSMSPVPC